MSYAERQILRLLRAYALNIPAVIEIINAIERGDHLQPEQPKVVLKEVA